MRIKTDLVILPQLKLQPKLKITPELKEQLRLLECPVQELEKEILKEIEENPFLEIDSSSEEVQENSYKEHNEEFGSDNEEFRSDYENLVGVGYDQFESYQEYEMFNPHLQNPDFVKYRQDLEQNLPSSEVSFSIENQIESHFKGEDLEIARAILYSLDYRGYLNLPPEEIVNSLKKYGIDADYQKFEMVRQEMMTKLDPPGIASKDWKEFFTLIVFRKTGVSPTPELIEKIEKLAEKYNKLLEVAFSKKNFWMQEDLREISMSIENEMPQELKDLKQKIDCIPLYPLQELIAQKSIENTYIRTGETLEPDIEVDLNSDETLYIRITKPYRIRITKIYDDKNLRNLKDWLRLIDNKDKSQILKVKEYIRRAKVIADGVKKRQEILLRVSKEIFAVQSKFLKSGKESDINALKLADLAERCGLSIGNISRAIKNKYVRTPHGIFPLKKFLSSAVETKTGEKISKLKLLKTLEEIIKEEDRKNPLSDSQIAKIIKEKTGVNIARRTVVKYREKMGIGNIAERKKLYEQHQFKE